MEHGHMKSWILVYVLFFHFQSSLEQRDCSLNFSSHPYRPVGGCAHVKESLDDWNGFPQSKCCQSVLLVFAHALAFQASANTSQYIFLPQDQWSNCTGPFDRQTDVSASRTCGFDSFYRGSGKCSTLQLSSTYQYIGDQCSLFSSFPFDYACGNCTSAVSRAVDLLLLDLKGDGSDFHERATCLVALIVSVIAQRTSRFSSETDDIDSCLPVLAKPVPERSIKINYSLAEALLAIVLVIIGMTAVISLIKHVMMRRKQEKQPLKIKDIAVSCSSLYRFSKVEIESAINSSFEKKYLGRGSAGQVYKGMLPSGQPVAIKQIYKSNTSDSFYREIDGLSRVRHSNLVCLFGYCVEDGEQYLVYEYCSNGNLAQHLLSKDSVLAWEDRVKILRDCAFALKYLHTHPDGCIVHRDIKLTNILLTHDMTPKLSDFGLAKVLGMEESKVYTDVRGTIGYMDPEYMSNAKLTCASDIYSFGIVILQLLSGQRVIDLDLHARDQLTTKAKDVNMQRRPIADFQDPMLKGEVVTVDFESILQLAVLCAASKSIGRPTIDLVFDELDKAFKNTSVEMKARRPSKSSDAMMKV